MKLFKTYLFFLLLTLQFQSPAQEPSIKQIGSVELSGVNVFDVIQDSNRYYWLATNMGIYRYDGYNFEKIDIKNSLSVSAFSLKKDKNDQLFFKNLSGQVFKIHDDSCSLFYEVPDSLKSRYFNYAFDDQNNLIIASKRLFAVKSNTQIDFLSKEKSSTFYNSFRQLADGTLIIPEFSRKEMHILKNGECSVLPLNLGIEQMNSFFLMNDVPYFVWKDKLFKIELNNAAQITETAQRFEHEHGTYKYYDHDQLLLVPNLAGGAYLYDEDFKPFFSGLILKNHVISCGMVDMDDNIILGTFGEGLILIPNINLKTISLPNEGLKTTQIAAGKDVMFLGFINGAVLKSNNQYTFKSFFKDSPTGLMKRIEVLTYFPEHNHLIIDRTTPVLLNIDSKRTTKLYVGAIKDVEKLGPDKYMTSSNQGVYFLKLNRDKATQVWESEPIENFKIRSQCANQDSKTKTIYAGTSSGLLMGSEENASLFRFKQADIMCTDIVYHENKMYVATQNHGILIFQNDSLIDQWDVKDDLLSNRIKQIKFHNDEIYVSSYDGMQTLSHKGENRNILNTSSGLSDNNILDFDILNEILWVVTVNEVQSVNIQYLNAQSVFKPTLSLTGILVNDSLINYENRSRFSHQQNKLEFRLNSISLKYQNEIEYQYRLKPIDKEWQVNDYLENKIQYKTLPPGDYVFKAKARCRDVDSNVVSYKFAINAPFWQKWWFYVLVLIVFLSVTIYVYKFQIKRQRRKIRIQNELNASKLIAIQSQMNPHFIFNAINSIQDLILQGDIDNSYNYVIKFSKLVRKTLEYSDKEFIDIESEVDLLETYLELEKLRFKKDFVYAIHLNGIENVVVPPMLVQPFVENAIKHGLLHKKGNKKVSISFHHKDDLVCEVEDNGIGREKAQEIKARQPEGYQSFSVNATKNRFEIMKSHYKYDLSLQYIDSDKGTKVIIRMPYKKQY